MPDHHVYILQCQDNSYYVGYTNNLGRRTSDHLANNGSKYTKEKRVRQLAYYETYPTKTQALKREKQLKGWSRAKKQALIKKNKEDLNRLSISHSSPRYLG